MATWSGKSKLVDTNLISLLYHLQAVSSLPYEFINSFNLLHYLETGTRLPFSLIHPLISFDSEVTFDDFLWYGAFLVYASFLKYVSSLLLLLFF